MTTQNFISGGFHTLLTPVLLAGLFATHSNAATLVTSTFTSVGLTGDQDINIAGPNVVDWGYYNERSNFFGNSTVDNKKAVSGIGTVTVSPGAISDATSTPIGSSAKFTVTYTGGTSPSTGSLTAIGAGLGAWAGNEDNAATFTFNNLGAGTHTVRFFAGHTSFDRIFDMDYSVTALDGGFSGNTLSNSISSGSIHSTYQLEFSTTDPSADLVLQFNSTSGGAGSGWIGGYVVETVPEPSSVLLGSLGILALLRRRR